MRFWDFLPFSPSTGGTLFLKAPSKAKTPTTYLLNARIVFLAVGVKILSPKCAKSTIHKRLMHKKPIYTIPLIEARIRKAMKEQKTYSKPMDIAISLAAGAYYSFLIARDALSDGKVSRYEMTREKHKKYVVLPEYYVMITSAELTRKYLRELRLTRATIEGESTEDDLTDLMDKVENIRNDKPTMIKKMKKDVE